eukprot:6088885-Amphidinium_carterae.2
MGPRNSSSFAWLQNVTVSGVLKPLSEAFLSTIQLQRSGGEWVGVQLDKPIGMHNGTVFDVAASIHDGQTEHRSAAKRLCEDVKVTYFDCPPKTGIMCSPSEIGLSMASA